MPQTPSCLDASKVHADEDVDAHSTFTDTAPSIFFHGAEAAQSPGTHSALASTHNSFSTSRFPSVPSTVADPFHISISSARFDDIDAPIFPTGLPRVAPPPPTVAPSASPHRVAGQQMVDDRPMLQLELSAPPGWRAFGYSRSQGQESNSGAIFMTVIA
jgi:hypothetical protein